MARTPYSRVHPTSILKGSGVNSNGYAGPSTSSSTFSPVENDYKFESQPTTLKRRSSVLDDEVGSGGPMRRIRPKPNLLAPRFHHTAHGAGIGSHRKQKLQLVGQEGNKVFKNYGENENESVPSASYAHVPSKSSEVAARILQHLENLTPKEKSSESKLAAVQEKPPWKLSPSMVSGQALRIREDVGSSKLLIQDDHKFGDRTNATLPDVHDSFPLKKGKAVENDPKVSIVPSGTWNSVLNNDSAVYLKASRPNVGATNSLVKNDASQPPQKKRAFRMNAQEDSLVQDDDLQCNGLGSRPLEFPQMGSKLAPAEEPILVNTTVQLEDKSPSGLISRKTSELSPGATTVGEGTSVTPGPASEETKAVSRSEVFASSVAAFDKPKEANNPPPLFNFSSKFSDKFPSSPSESIKRHESEIKSSSSLVNIFAPTGSEVKVPESDKDFHQKLPKAGYMNGKCDDVSSAASNGPLPSNFSPVVPVASSNDTNQTSTGSGLLFTSSTSMANFVSTGTSTGTSATSSGSIFGLASKPSGLAGTVFKFGSSVDPAAVSVASTTTTVSEVADQKTNIEINPSSFSSSRSHSTVAAFAAANSGFGSSFSHSTGNNLPDSLFGSASKSVVSDAGTISQGPSVQSVSSMSLPTFNFNPSTSFGSLSPNPTNTFGFSSASSSGNSSLVPVGGPTSSLGKFDASSTAVSSSTTATPGVFSFGISSSSSSAAGSSSGATSSIFDISGNSSLSASVTNTANPFSSGTSGMFKFGESSFASASAINSFSSSSAPSNVFGSSWQSPKSPIFGSSFTSPSSSPSSMFFSAPSSSSVSTNTAAPMVFNSSTVAPSSAPIFSFASSSAPALSPPSISNTQPVFGNPTITGGFAASAGNNDQMNGEDSMAEDPVPSSASAPVFGQPSVSPGFTFGLSAPPQTSPFMFGGQQNQVAQQNQPPFQASGSLEFNAGGSFSLGSGGGDKSGRKIVKINRNKNRRK